MSLSTESTVPDDSMLPDEDYTLVPASKLVHGEHNPRREKPKDTLRQSIKGSGINCPLIVWYDDENDVYHITDGWQRYQAAVDADWKMLPVKVCESIREALDETKDESAGRRAWGPYEWAQFCQSMAQEIQTDDDSKMDIARKVAEAVDLNVNTVRRYLNVLSLPQVIHPLLTVGPDGSAQQWAHLQNHNTDIRQYKGLRLQVADRLATLQSSVQSDERLIAIATYAVEFSEPEDAIEFIEKAVENTDQRLDMVQREILVGNDHNQYLIAPRVAIKLSPEKRRAVMDHCHEQRRQLSDIVSEKITSLAEDVCETEGATDEDVSDGATPENREEN